MKIKDILTESLNRKDTYKILLDFIKFAADHLELKSLPKFDFKFDSKRSVEHHSFGGYGGKHINITVVNRHINDVCRTLAHELVHYRQDLKGQLNDESGKTGSPEENEANAEAAVIMRKWGELHPEYFSYDSIE